MSRIESEEHNERQAQRRNDSGAHRPVSQYRAPEADNIIRRVMEIIEASPGLPMSASVRVNKDEVVSMLSEALSMLPEELRTARWLLKEREEFLAKQHREGEEMIAAAAARAAQMVDRKSIVKAADARATQIVDDAEATSRRMLRETEDFCDQKLASFENSLAKVQKTVAVARRRLAAPTIEEAELGSGSAGSGGGSGSPAGAGPGPRPGGPAQSQTGGPRGGGPRRDPRGQARGQVPDPAADVFDQDR
ncbi:MAG: hypothetical protein WBA45_13360 [Microthrixaceae bacterium]